MDDALPVPADGKDWQPGDIFTLPTAWAAPVPISAGLGPARRPRPDDPHNIGAGAREGDALLDWPITGRFRWKV